tara:strand:+ start:181 stop:1164 length:984 start_codon:yes stop_codon:yes gene_type:complete
MGFRSFVKKYLFFSIYIIAFVEFIYAYFKFVIYSGIFKYPITRNKLLGRIVEGYHSVERSLALPNVRLGFAQKHIAELVELNSLYFEKYGLDTSQIIHSIEVVNEYQHYHKKFNYSIDDDLDKKIELLKEKTGVTNHSLQITTNAQNYFENQNAPFKAFSFSRKSVRKYKNKIIPREDLNEAFLIAQNAPSACNRQGARIHLIEDKELIQTILSIHVGTGGFKNTIHKLIVLTEDMEISNGVFEKNQVYIDGGIFLMNILYALHYKGIAACPLNNSFSIKQDRKIRKLLKIKESECFIAFVSLGYPEDDLVVTTSKKRDLSEIVNFH